MGKRKVSTNGDAKQTNKKQKPSISSDELTEKTKLNLTTPIKVISSLLNTKESPISYTEFNDKYWEQQPLYIKRKDEGYYGDLFSLEMFKTLLKDEELNFESDVNVCRYVEKEKTDSKKEEKGGERKKKDSKEEEKGVEMEKEILNEEGRITVAKMNKLFNNKNATFQIHQPQRYVDILWNLMEKMETHFGCLVGANVYITPKNSQGLAPHCDDVEIFVLQLEGKKTWKLYDPMVKLSRDYTQDLQEADIGKPIMEQTLEPGDMLYFPRGTIHQAATSSDGHSTHISISTYQQNTYGDFMNHAVTQAIENAIEENLEMRRGLPTNYLKTLGTRHNMSKYIEMEEGKKLPSNEEEKPVKDFKETIKKHLSDLIDHIDVNTAADAMSVDFMTNRLPPYGHTITEDDEEDRKVLSLEDQVKIRYPEHVRVMYSDDDQERENADISQLNTDDESDEEMEEEKPAKTKQNGNHGQKRKSIKSDTEDDDDEDDDEATVEEEPCVRIYHSLNNDRESHMCGDTLDNEGICSLKLPLHYAAAALAIVESNDFMAIKDLPLEDDDDKLTIATTLFADDLIEIKGK